MIKTYSIKKFAAVKMILLSTLTSVYKRCRWNKTWPDGYLNRYKNQLCSGSYSVNVKDKNGCSINVTLISP
ncbi:MAG: hypothetical protein HYU69_15510 [Bacteroidetes bacterium]|nr:hypothetical protein [Bacteroidota bacterium]